MSYVIVTMPLSDVVNLRPSRFQSLSQDKAIYNESHLRELDTKMLRLGLSEFFCNPQSPITVTLDNRLKQGHHRTEVLRRQIEEGRLDSSVLTMQVPVLKDTVSRTTEQVASDLIVANRKQAQANEINVLLHGTSRYSEKVINPAWKIFNKLFVTRKLLTKGNVAKVVLPLAACMYREPDLNEVSDGLTGDVLYRLFKDPMSKDAAVLLGATGIPTVWSKVDLDTLSARLAKFSDALAANKANMDTGFKKIWTVYYTLFSLAIRHDFSVKQWERLFKYIHKNTVTLKATYQGQFLNSPANTSSAIEADFLAVLRG